MGIGQRVRAVHLSQYCPGGLGFPAGSPGAAGAGALGWPGGGPPDPAGHAAQAAGETCERCGRQITRRQAVRRRAHGGWVHEACRAASRVTGLAGPPG
jgi:hypothetical protein